jgi:hypothetical protein
MVYPLILITAGITALTRIELQRQLVPTGGISNYNIKAYRRYLHHLPILVANTAEDTPFICN